MPTLAAIMLASQEQHCSIDFFFLRFIAQTVYTECTRINYIIVPVTNLNKY
jgi:hypothetical protein